MKNYEEVTKSVFRKSEEIIARNERRRNTIMTVGMSACCLAAVCGVGTIAWNRARNTVPVESSAQFVSDDYANAPGAGDTVTSTASNPITDNNIPTNHWDEYCYTQDDNGNFSQIFTTTIRGFEAEDSEEKIAPDNGQIHISKALKAAMEHYGNIDENGNEIVYYVVITYFQDHHKILSTEEHYKKELDRFEKQLNHSLSFSFVRVCGPNHEQTIFANLTKSEIENLTADPNYGYVIELHDENDYEFPTTEHPANEQAFYDSITNE